MRVVVTGDAVAFRDAVFPVLSRDPVRYSVMLTAVGLRADGITRDPAPATYLRVLDDDDAVVGTAMRTPPWGVMLGAMPDELVGPVTEVMAREAPDASGVQGTQEHARQFAEGWQELTGRPHELHHGLRLHRLAELTVPAADGEPRLATDADEGLLIDWYQEFGDDVGQPMAREKAEGSVRERIDAGRAWLWYDGDRPVSLVAHTREAFGVSRIGPVYTPAEHRGHGYASALTAHVSQLIRQAGNDACLYTDLANPVSNKIYAAIGYEPVGDFVDYTFG